MPPWQAIYWVALQCFNVLGKKQTYGFLPCNGIYWWWAVATHSWGLKQVVSWAGLSLCLGPFFGTFSTSKPYTYKQLRHKTGGMAFPLNIFWGPFSTAKPYTCTNIHTVEALHRWFAGRGFSFKYFLRPFLGLAAHQNLTYTIQLRFKTGGFPGVSFLLDIFWVPFSTYIKTLQVHTL